MTEEMKTEIEKRIKKTANKYTDSCDNESGGFLSHQLVAIREKAFKAGAKFVLDMPEIRNVLDFYAGNYMDGCKCSNERTCFLCRDYFFLKKAGLA